MTTTRWRISNVYVDTSTIPKAGLGLFAGTRGFRQGQVVCEYSDDEILVPLSTLMKESEACEARGDHQGFVRCWMYVYQSKHLDEHGEEYCWDARHKTTHLASLINDARSDQLNNVKFVDRAPRTPMQLPRCLMVATRDIVPGEELFVSYGDEYWNSLYPSLSLTE